MFKHLFLACFLLISFHLSVRGQESDLLIGEWKNFYPTRNGLFITQSKDEIFYANQYAILVCDKSAGIKRTITRVSGLTDIDLGPIKYTPFSNTLIVSYSNGNIDLYRNENEVTNLNYIKVNTNIVGKKTLNHIYLKNDSIALLSADFGLMVLDLSKQEFSSTVFTPYKIKSTCVLNDSIFVATDGGAYLIPPGINIQDFGQWKLIDLVNGASYNSTACVLYNQKLYLSCNDTLIKYESGNQYESLYYEKNTRINYLSAEGEHLICGLFCTTNSYCLGKILIADTSDQVIQLSGSSCFNRPYNAVEDSNNRVWLADEWDEFKYYDIKSNNCSTFTVNSPRSETNFDITIANGNTYITSGGLILGQNYSFNSNGLYIYDNKEKVWSTVNSQNFPLLSQEEAQFDFLYVVPDPSQPEKLYVGSYYGGLIEYFDNNIKIYNEKNSAIRGGVGDEKRERIAGLAFDSNGNLWMANTLAPKPIVVYKKDGSWQSFPVNSSTGLFQLAIDQNNNKWFVIGGQSGALYVFNEGNDFNNTSDDRWREINTGNSNLPSNTVNCVSVDKNGDVWVGTAAGPIVFDCGGDVFNSNCKGTRVIVEQDGFGAYLLETENIKTIKVDGGNRKWFGTDNGVFVQSADVKTQLFKFDTKNSPLPSNSITSMAINPDNGETWIGTTKGFAVYRSEATEGGAFHKSNVYAFPNPVRPDYFGPIVITGLAADSNVKITDTNGKLVFETKAAGGQATWDGNDYTGRRANSGVYLVFGTGTASIETPETIVTKILLIQ